MEVGPDPTLIGVNGKIPTKINCLALSLVPSKAQFVCCPEADQELRESQSGPTLLLYLVQSPSPTNLAQLRWPMH